MRSSVSKLLVLGMMWALGAAAVGCDATSPSNLSPTPDQAADRHERAVLYSEQRASKNQEAERKAMSRKHPTPVRK